MINLNNEEVLIIDESNGYTRKLYNDYILCDPETYKNIFGNTANSFDETTEFYSECHIVNKFLKANGYDCSHDSKGRVPVFRKNYINFELNTNVYKFNKNTVVIQNPTQENNNTRSLIDINKYEFIYNGKLNYIMTCWIDYIINKSFVLFDDLCEKIASNNPPLDLNNCDKLLNSLGEVELSLILTFNYLPLVNHPNLIKYKSKNEIIDYILFR